jgi:hypothetical protein
MPWASSCSCEFSRVLGTLTTTEYPPSAVAVISSLPLEIADLLLVRPTLTGERVWPAALTSESAAGLF